MPRPDDYDDLIMAVLRASRHDQLAELRQQLVHRKARSESAEERGILTACELASLHLGTDERVEPLVLQACTTHAWQPKFVNALGCALSDLGREAADGELLHAAASVLSRAIDQLGKPEPDHAELFANHGLVLERLGHLHDAISHFERALDVAPELVSVQALLGRAHRSNGDLGRAAAAYERHLERRPVDYVALVALKVGLRTSPELCQERLLPTLFDAWLFSDDVLMTLKEHEHASDEASRSFRVLIEAFSNEGYFEEPGPVAYVVGYHVIARDEEHAAQLAVAFERRCGADRARSCDVEFDVDLEHDAPVGVWSRGGTIHTFPAEDYDSVK